MGAGGELERGLTLWGEGVIVVSRCCSFHKTMPKSMIKQLPLQEYAALLCETVERYNYPPVTYDFINKCEIRHENMHDVEKCIGNLLYSECLYDVKDGLAKILYWGDKRFTNRAQNFSNMPYSSIKNELMNLIELTKKIKKAKNNNQILSAKKLLLKINKISIPQFTSGVPFASKLLMFLDPEHYPILDSRIAKVYANSFFLPLNDLTFNPKNGSIQIIKSNNADVYGEWAYWCQRIAKLINGLSEPSYQIRAVDVERALFTLADSLTTEDCIRRVQILAGPKRSWFGLVASIFRI